MKNKSYMLPYSYRKYGYGLIIAAILALPVGLLLANVLEVIPQTHTRFIAMTMYIFFFLGLFVVVMSEEKDEDEMIAAIRRKSVSLTALIAFGLFILINLIIALAHGFRSLNTLALALTTIGLTNVLTFIIIYLTTFRISLWKMRRQCKEDEA
jgi:peptidoglycan/LPS O-acetylase OafA/YrhL